MVRGARRSVKRARQRARAGADGVLPRLSPHAGSGSRRVRRRDPWTTMAPPPHAAATMQRKILLLASAGLGVAALIALRLHEPRIAPKAPLALPASSEP